MHKLLKVIIINRQSRPSVKFFIQGNSNNKNANANNQITVHWICNSFVARNLRLFLTFNSYTQIGVQTADCLTCRKASTGINSFQK